MSRLTVLLCLLLLLSNGAGATAQERALARVGVDQKRGDNVPLDLRFTDSHGQAVTLGELIDGKPTVLELAWYSCPNLCDLSLHRLGSQLSDVKYTPGKDYQVITLSIDPDEGVEQSAHARRMLDESYQGGGQSPGPWRVLTGDEQAIRTLAAAIGFSYQYDAESEQYAHPAGLVVLTGEGRISSYLLGLLFSGRDLQIALTHAANGELGSIADQVVLRCFHFDPKKGVYTLDVLRVLNIACLLTVVALAVLVGGLLWRRRRADSKRGRH